MLSINPAVERPRVYCMINYFFPNRKKSTQVPTTGTIWRMKFLAPALTPCGLFVLWIALTLSKVLYGQEYQRRCDYVNYEERQPMGYCGRELTNVLRATCSVFAKRSSGKCFAVVNTKQQAPPLTPYAFDNQMALNKTV